MSNPAPIDGIITSRADGEANFYTLIRTPDGDRRPDWFARIQWNGMLLVERQDQLTAQVVHALNAHRAHPLADLIASIANGDTYSENAILQAKAILESVHRRTGDAMQALNLIALGAAHSIAAHDAAVLLAAVEPLYIRDGLDYRNHQELPCSTANA